MPRNSGRALQGFVGGSRREAEFADINGRRGGVEFHDLDLASLTWRCGPTGSKSKLDAATQEDTARSENMNRKSFVVCVVIKKIGSPGRVQDWSAGRAAAWCTQKRTRFSAHPTQKGINAYLVVTGDDRYFQ